ncbi:hypothetical protein EDB89DRAFT_440551 [Lactarius sanguifluus]|nr:hypothetical protein EDB89DRAFT_440551 [Lactarius sanguifluus]
MYRASSAIFPDQIDRILTPTFQLVIVYTLPNDSSYQASYGAASHGPHVDVSRSCREQWGAKVWALGTAPSTTATSVDLGGTGKSYVYATTIDMLPDDVLLDIFDFCRVDEAYYPWTLRWARLAHVCRKWRQVIFASPRRLRLQLGCARRTPVRKYLDVWPAFPIDIYYYIDDDPTVNENLIAALEHPNRVYSLRFYYVTTPEWEKLAPVIRSHFQR